MLGKLALLAALASSCSMTGLVAFVQVVHYPLFGRVGRRAFGRYHAAHVRLTSAVVVGPMAVELAASLVLVAYRPGGTGAGLAWFGLGMVAVAWLSTGLLSVPLHNRLAVGFDLAAHRALVATNLVRLAAWSAHSVTLMVMTAGALR